MNLYAHNLERKVTIPLPTPAVHARHPLVNEATHDDLLAYVKARISTAINDRDLRARRYSYIDSHYLGLVRKAQTNESVDLGTGAVEEMSLPVLLTQIEDMSTYFLQTFAPNRGMFYHSAKEEVSASVEAVTELMNSHAIHAGYYRQLSLSVGQLLRYNLGGLHNEWISEYGPKLIVADAQHTQTQKSVIWSGNRTKGLDMYNTFWDPHCEPQAVHKDAEFAGFIEVVGRYKLLKMAENSEVFNTKDTLESETGCGQMPWYIEAASMPELSRTWLNKKSNSGHDWGHFFGVKSTDLTKGYEIATVYIRIDPTQFGLIPRNERSARNRLELWQIKILGGSQIIATKHVQSAHDHIPVYLGRIHDDNLGEAQRSVGEVIQPFQQFADHLMNGHVKSANRNLFGACVYDPSVVDMSKIPAGTVNFRIPANPTARGTDLSKAVVQLPGTLDNSRTLEHMSQVLDLQSSFFPASQAPSQIAGIDRAVSDQVAAVQQGTNRRNQKGARLLDETILIPLRAGMFWNIITNQQAGAGMTAHGKPFNFDPAIIGASDLPNILGQGLKAIDQQASANVMTTMVHALIQNPIAMQQIGANVLEMFNYWALLQDLDIDFKRFMPQPPMGAGGPADPAAGGDPTQIDPAAAMGAGGPPPQE